MSLGLQLICTAFAAVVLGHVALGMMMADSVRRSVWRPLMFFGYGACAFCLIVGLLMVIWS